MTHAELREAFAGQGASNDLLRLAGDEAWRRETEAALAAHRSELWTRVSFAPDLALSCSRATRDELTQWLHCPAETGDRDIGWSFHSSAEEFRPLGGDDTHPDGFVAGGPDGYTWIEVRRTGEIRFRAPIARLEWRAARTLYPYALVELPTSVVRLAARLHAEHSGTAEDRVLLDIGLIGVQGKQIRPGAPGSIAYELESTTLEAETVRAEPQEATGRDLAESPDACAWRALTALYLRLGLLEDRMPVGVYDQRHRKLRFPR